MSNGGMDFNHWFKGSKVVDLHGHPLIVFHGSRSQGEAIKVFDLKHCGKQADGGWMGQGFYFGDERTANAYAGQRDFDPDHFPVGGVIYPVYLSLQNPAIWKQKVCPSSSSRRNK